MTLPVQYQPQPSPGSGDAELVVRPLSEVLRGVSVLRGVAAELGATVIVRRATLISVAVAQS